MKAGTKPNRLDVNPKFEEIYAQNYDRVWRFLLHATGDVPAALDLTSAVFFRAVRAWPRFDSTRAPVHAWLLRIAVNEWRRELRRRRLSRFVPLIEARDEAEIVGNVAEPEVNAAIEALAKDDEYKALRAAMAALPPKYSAPLFLRYFEQLSLDEVAAVLGRPVGTVKSLLHRGLAKLRQNQGLRECFGLTYAEAKPATPRGSL